MPDEFEKPTREDVESVEGIYKVTLDQVGDLEKSRSVVLGEPVQMLSDVVDTVGF